MSCEICLESFKSPSSSPKVDGIFGVDTATAKNKEDDQMTTPVVTTVGHCGHTFHFACLQTWEQSPGNKDKCPTCLDLEDLEDQNGLSMDEELSQEIDFGYAREQALALEQIVEKYRQEAGDRQMAKKLQKELNQPSFREGEENPFSLRNLVKKEEN